MYIKQLDGIRCFAVLSVVLSHTLYYPAITFFKLGNIGVDIFFTLSGFLITGILVTEKEKLRQSSTGSNGMYLKNFYVRRMLRIFPLYYLTIFICLLFSFSPIKHCFLWLLTYSCNWPIAFTYGDSDFMQYSHFWSLAVEEQFYIFFPFIILFVSSKRKILYILSSLITIAVLSRIIFSASLTLRENATYYSTISCLDVLCFGSLLFFLKDLLLGKLKKTGKFQFLFLQIMMVLLFLSSNSIFKNTGWGIITGRSFTALVTCLLIFHSSNNSLPFLLNKLLLQKPIVYLGKISYGMYILHPLIIKTYRQYLEHKVSAAFPEFIALFLAIVLFAAISWELFEKRILLYKNKFINI
jgi:peptidoglycan/LPS O-acetylase OafA/YrhL